ncbi:hypothetical protein FRC10_000623 [Ceratobasidium sp. 414]|nr:hypothetical protein FRC10_000623 [Ceratobasidium sp. 414]
MLHGDRSNSAAEWIMWVTVLLTQSLTFVHTRGTGVTSALGISLLLRTISISCTGVQTLYLPPVSHSTEEQDGEHYLFNLLPNRPIPESLLVLSNLCELTVGLWIFQPEFLQALGNLPRLASLKLLPNFDDSATEDPESVSLHESSFPALKRLTLQRFFWSHIGVVLSHQLLVKDLVFLELTAVDDESESWDDAEVALPTLEGMRDLAELTIDFGVGDHYGIHLGGTIAHILSRLPLRTVRLAHAHFLGLDEFHPSQIFPAVTELQIPDQFVGLGDFSGFAEMPNLKGLTVRPHDFSITDLTTSGEVPVCPSFGILELACIWDEPFPVEDVPDVAKYFLKLFPNMKKITLFDGTIDDERSLALLNVCIAMIRERNGARTRIAEQYGWDVADRLLPDADESLKSIL